MCSGPGVRRRSCNEEDTVALRGREGAARTERKPGPEAGPGEGQLFMLLIEFTHVISDLHMAEQGKNECASGNISQQCRKRKRPEEFSPAHMAIKDQVKSLYRPDDNMR